MEFGYTPINKKDTPVVSKYDVISIGGELCHHGILGMKWGKRNGPPYPLKPEDHSAAEKKAGYKKSIDGGKPASPKKKQLKDNVKAYSKKYDEASKLEDKADEAWNTVKEQYKSLGKNRIQRVLEVRKAQKGKGSEAAKEYLKAFDKASELSDKANTSQDLNSIAKKLGEKADKVSEKYAKKAYKASSKNTMKVYRKGQKELAKVGEEFLDSYMKNKGVTEVDVNKLNKEYSASVRKAIDAIVQNERDSKSRYYADIQMNKDKSQIERIMLKKSEKN